MAQWTEKRQTCFHKLAYVLLVFLHLQQRLIRTNSAFHNYWYIVFIIVESNRVICTKKTGTKDWILWYTADEICVEAGFNLSMAEAMTWTQSRRLLNCSRVAEGCVKPNNDLIKPLIVGYLMWLPRCDLNTEQWILINFGSTMADRILLLFNICRWIICNPSRSTSASLPSASNVCKLDTKWTKSV